MLYLKYKDRPMNQNNSNLDTTITPSLINGDLLYIMRYIDLLFESKII